LPNSVNIVLVDDEKLCRQGLAALLKGTEVKILGEAENGSQLFHLLKTVKPHVVVLDLEMPVLNGSKTLNRIKKEFPDLRTLILSKYYNEELIKDMFNRGANGFVSKTSSIETVMDALRGIRKKGLYRDNIPALLKNPAVKDRHYYKLLLTPREIVIMGLIYQSKTYKQISEELDISENTVENHAKSVYKKMEVKSRSEFGILAAKLGLHYIGG
jgi:DNA-binding NarL/FixJ family response regulator